METASCSSSCPRPPVDQPCATDDASLPVLPVRENLSAPPGCSSPSPLFSSSSRGAPNPAHPDGTPDDLLGQVLVPEAWDEQRFHHKAILREAPRNQGYVEVAVDTITNSYVAVKVMPMHWVCDNHDEFRIENPFETEWPWRDIAVVKYLSDVQLSSNCICDYVGLFLRERADQTPELCFVTSYCDGGDLFTWLERSLEHTGANDREAVAQPLLARVVQAVHEIHQRGIAHGDLSLENVLLASKMGSNTEDQRGYELRLIDFGASCAQMAVGARGKPSYEAPEMHISGHAYDAFAADVFSIGVMLFTLVVGNYPWKSTKPYICQMFTFVCQTGLEPYLAKRKLQREDGCLVSLLDLLSPSVVNLMQGLLHVDPVERFTTDIILQHPWIARRPRGFRSR